ncbi:MAG: hypothetical protein HY653_08865 [Acidobacteria bacterium]|nr:hypothetical protein [Acidobacteriota bacterium]
MNPSLRYLIYIVAATAFLAIGLWVYLRWKARHKDPAELERCRREHVNRIGRIANGRVIELLDSPDGVVSDGPHLISYRYEVRGVEYQAAQDLTFLGDQAGTLDLGKVASGQSISVKFDPKNPSNSIILCEVWSGL